MGGHVVANLISPGLMTDPPPQTPFLNRPEQSSSLIRLTRMTHAVGDDVPVHAEAEMQTLSTMETLETKFPYASNFPLSSLFLSPLATPLGFM